MECKALKNDTTEFNTYLGNGCKPDLVQDVCFQFCDYENPEHLKVLAEMINQYMTDPMGNMIPLNKIQQLRMVDGLANHPSSFVLFLILEEEVVGLAACFINFSTFHARPYLNIHDIIVDNKHRGKGYGKMLMSELIVLSEQRKYCKITLEVREDNVIAQKLYTHMGFEESNPKMLFWTKKL